MDLCHNLKGRIVVYVLQCAPDAEGRECRYVGCSTNIERRTAEHLGLKAGGAAWCRKHKPVSVLECRVCNSKEEACVMENMLTAVHQEQVGYQNCRGSRWNMPGMMRRKPPYFDNAEEYYTEDVTPEKESAATTPETPPAVVTPPEWVPPALLPPAYETLRDENGITEKPPVSCPCFRQPHEEWRHLAGLMGS